MYCKYVKYFACPKNIVKKNLDAATGKYDIIILIYIFNIIMLIIKNNKMNKQENYPFNNWLKFLKINWTKIFHVIQFIELLMLVFTKLGTDLIRARK